ncbi:uncharacterized protein LOC103512990 [Diaphorina citri]|uniref:Uncharacterized protein LOC103512990 n=1 Tax=Diaphorina citri TaxID=121845 RepID=A0A3Q0J588_DIACI|nr:uncharacterized protein LOC103512990 [Diaphorina citri]
MTSADGMKVLCVRLVRGDDLKVKLKALVEENNIRAGFIVSCVGSVSQATLRFATQVNGEHEIRTLSQNMEITSLVGTFSPGDQNPIPEHGDHLPSRYSLPEWLSPTYDTL